MQNAFLSFSDVGCAGQKVADMHDKAALVKPIT